MREGWFKASKSALISSQWEGVEIALWDLDNWALDWPQILVRAAVEVGAIPYRERYQVRF